PVGQLDILYQRKLLSPGLVLCALLYLVAFGLLGARINRDPQARKRPSVKWLLLFGLAALVLPPLVGLMVNRIPWPGLADLALLALQLSFPVCLLLLVGVAHELCAKLVARAGAPSVAALGAALQGAGQLAAVQGDAVAALASFEEALTLFRLLGRVPEI